MRKVNEENSEEHSEKEGLKALDTAAIENPELVTSVQARLNNLNAITKEVDDPAVSEEEPDGSIPEVKDDSDVEDDDQAELEEESDDSTPVAKDTDGSDIPDAYVRAGLHRGWEQDVIDELIKSNPELAKKTLEACYLEVNNASKEWSALGRARRDQELKDVNKTATETTEQKDIDVTPVVEKLKKEYPDDPLIDSVVKVLEQTTKMANAKPQVPQGQQQYQTATARANATANASMDQRINNFFGSDVMKPYAKFYGKLELGQSVTDLSSGQQQNRLAVLDDAEMILSGHRMHGIDLDVIKALEKAHFVVTEPIREQVIRDNLKVAATKRKKSMTLRPSDSKRSPQSESQGKPKNRSELISKVEQKLASVPGLR